MIVPHMHGVGRATRIVAYACMVIGGATLAPQIDDTVGIVAPLWYVMVVWLVLGGLASMVGQVVHRWTGEFVGLPLVGSALLGFGVLQANVMDWSWSVVPSTALLWSFGLVMLSRWRDVLYLYRAALAEGQVP